MGIGATVRAEGTAPSTPLDRFVASNVDGQAIAVIDVLDDPSILLLLHRTARVTMVLITTNENKLGEILN